MWSRRRRGPPSTQVAFEQGVQPERLRSADTSDMSIKGLSGTESSGLRRGAGLQPDVGRNIDQQRWVTHGERRQEELLVRTVQAVVHRAHAEAVGDDLAADAAGAVVDHEGILDALEHVLVLRVQVEAGERLAVGGLVVEDRP